MKTFDCNTAILVRLDTTLQYCINIFNPKRKEVNNNSSPKKLDNSQFNT